MKVKILGTAAATAMPLPFCRCPVCICARSGGGKDIRKRSSALINDDLLIDLSPDLSAMAAMHGADLSKIRYLLQTHSHSDHFDAGHLATRHVSYAPQNQEHLTVMCSAATLEDMNHWVRLNEPGLDLHREDVCRDMALTVLTAEPFRPAELGDYIVTPLDSMHDPRVEAFIYLIEQDGRKLLYATDLLCISEPVWKFLSAHVLDALIIDRTYGEGFNAGGHTDAGQVKAIAARMREAGVAHDRTLIFATHISHEGGAVHAELEAEACMHGYHIAYDGMEFVL